MHSMMRIANLNYEMYSSTHTIKKIPFLLSVHSYQQFTKEIEPHTNYVIITSYVVINELFVISY